MTLAADLWHADVALHMTIYVLYMFMCVISFKFPSIPNWMSCFVLNNKEVVNFAK